MRCVLIASFGLEGVTHLNGIVRQDEVEQLVQFFHLDLPILPGYRVPGLPTHIHPVSNSRPSKLYHILSQLLPVNPLVWSLNQFHLLAYLNQG